MFDASIIFLNSKEIVELFRTYSEELLSTYLAFSLPSWSICSDTSMIASWSFFFRLRTVASCWMVISFLWFVVGCLLFIWCPLLLCYLLLVVFYCLLFAVCCLSCWFFFARRLFVVSSLRDVHRTFAHSPGPAECAKRLE